MVVDTPASDSTVSQPNLLALYEELVDLVDRIEQASTESTTDAELLRIAEIHERTARRWEGLGLRLLAEIDHREAYRTKGFSSLQQFVIAGLRITEPKRRIDRMRALTEQVTADGERIGPQYPAVAEGVRTGDLGAGHVDELLDILDQIPEKVSDEDKAAAEESLAEEARKLTPAKINLEGQRLLGELNPDGATTSDADRARRRDLYLEKQDVQLMSGLKGRLDPTTRAMFETVMSVWAAPGMNNPLDAESPSGAVDAADPEVLEQARKRDDRTLGQRRHDAFAALLRATLDGGLLGSSHRGLPPHLLIKVTLADLNDAAGIAETATGTALPLSDLVHLAAQAQPYLVVFEDHSILPLELVRGNRLASQAQRLALFAAHEGCTAPGCNLPAVMCEIHHADVSWADGGTTDIGNLAPACGRHNRMVGPEPGQFTTEVIRDGPDAGRIAWTLNPAPGDPPNEPQINRHVGIIEAYARNRARLRAAEVAPDDPETG